MAAPGGYSARVEAEPVAPQIGLISLPELALLGTEVSNVVVSRRPACEPSIILVPPPPARWFCAVTTCRHKIQLINPPGRMSSVTQVGPWGLASAFLSSFLPAINLAMAQEVASPRSIALATASPGGVYFVYGQALAPILSRALQIEVTAEPTQGAVQNVILLEKRETMLAFINVGPALQG